MCIHVYVYTYVYMYVCLFLCIYIYVYIYTCILYQIYELLQHFERLRVSLLCVFTFHCVMSECFIQKDLRHGSSMHDIGWQRHMGCRIFNRSFCAKETYNYWLICEK